MLLADSTASPLYIFHDENQNVYTRASTFPADASPITLTANCRNTKQIHNTAYQFYSGEQVDPPELSGDVVKLLIAYSTEQQAKLIREFLSKMLTVEHIAPSSMVVLIADRLKRRTYEEAFKRQTLPSSVVWTGVDDREQNGVVVETVARFKGLEAEIIILWGVDDLPKDDKHGTLYVGVSRAKSRLLICGSKSTCDQILVEG